MENNSLILAENQYYSLDCYETKLNNNVLVVGSSGAGKTRSIVEPNILQATGSYIVSDPKGNLYKKYKAYLEEKGYEVKKLDFTHPLDSCYYNFFRYINSTQDIVKVAHMMIYQKKEGKNVDPFWDQAAQLLLQSVIAYAKENFMEKEQNLKNVMRLISLCEITEEDADRKNTLDALMEKLEKKDSDSYAVKCYKKFRIAAGRTLRSILISINARIGLFDTREMNIMTSKDDVDIESIGKKKTALFVVVSDTDRSQDGIANIFFTQAMNVLCEYADRKCSDNRLPVPVRFILDDFATNCKIEEFPRMIASIRSRGISAMLMIQAESQLAECYGQDGKTIIGNCDSYVYLGGNDVETAKAVAERCDIPVKKILNMPVGSNWIFRRGQAAINGKNFDLEAFYSKMTNSKKEKCER